MNRDEYTGCLVKSRAGHDTGEIYLVTGEDEKTVLLCDGKNRSLSKPKRKNKKHLALLVNGYERCLQPDDIKSRKMIREYKRVLQNTKEEDNV